MRLVWKRREMCSDPPTHHLFFTCLFLLLNLWQSRLLYAIDLTPSVPAKSEDEECLICVSCQATILTYPCEHQVLCQRCFIKTIQNAVKTKQLPLTWGTKAYKEYLCNSFPWSSFLFSICRCVVCRTRITNLKQQSSSSSSSSLHSMVDSKRAKKKDSRKRPTKVNWLGLDIRVGRKRNPLLNTL